MADGRLEKLLNRHSERPLAAIVCFLSCGIASAGFCPCYCFAGLVAAATLLIAAAVLAFRRRRLKTGLAAGLLATAVCGLLLGIAERDCFPESDLRSHISRGSFGLGEPVSFEGCVVKESELRGEESTATVELLAFLRGGEWMVSRGKGILRIAAPQDPNYRLLRGDRVRGWATWRQPRNFENPGSIDTAGLLLRRGVFVSGRIKSSKLLERIPGGCATPWTRMANSVAAQVRRSLEPVQSGHGSTAAAILASLVIGDYSGLDNATRVTFQNSGTFHILVVSGLHVAWIAGLILECLNIIRVPERIRYGAAALIILLYTCVVGFQASITRCLWMFLLYLTGRLLFRHADAANILLGSAVLLLSAKPNWILETGFLLSFISVLAIVMMAGPVITACWKPVCEPVMNSGNAGRLFLQPGHWHRIGRRLRIRLELTAEALEDRTTQSISEIVLFFGRGAARAGFAIGSLIISSVAVQLWLEPLLAFFFNRMSWVSPFANLVMVPFSSVVLGSGIAAAAFAGIPLIGPWLVDLSGALASALLACGVKMTAFDWTWQRCPTPSLLCVLTCLLLLFIWNFLAWRKVWIPCAATGLLLASLSYGSVPVAGILIREFHYALRDKSGSPWDRQAPLLRLTFLDVGEGDSVIAEFPDKRVWLIDGGGMRQPPSETEAAYGFDIGEAVVSRFLWHEWIGRINRLVLTHPDTDHAGGLPAIMNNFAVTFFEYSASDSDPIIARLLNIAHRKGTIARRPLAGRIENIGPVHVNVLSPSGEKTAGSTNDNSIVLEIRYGRFSALLTGDLEKAGEAELLNHSTLTHCRLLKVAHHGSRSGTSNALLERTRPQWAVLSAGRNNPYGHPSKETLNRLHEHGARPIATMDEGAITFETDGARYILMGYLHGVLESGIL